MRRLAVVLLVLTALLPGGCARAPQRGTTGTRTADQAIAAAFNARRDGVEVQDSGTVTRILGDDVDGDRHQRFILRLGSGQTLLVAHNVDIAPRLAPLSIGDEVEFRGEYAWNDEGGVIHWTHHDPSGTHEAGWLRHGATVVQ